MRVSKNYDCTNCIVNECLIAKYSSRSGQAQVNSAKIVASYKKHQPIVKEETTAMGIYIIYSGKVLIVSEKEHGSKQIIRIAKPGDIIEHKENENKLRSPFTAEAFGESVICYIPKTIYFQLIKEDPRLANSLERFYTNKFIKAEKKLKNFMIMNVQAKMADALLMVADSFDGEIPFSRKELAELTGVSVDQVSRELKKLMSERIISKDSRNKEIAITDFSKLLNIVKRYDQNYSFSIIQNAVKKQKPN